MYNKRKLQLNERQLNDIIAEMVNESLNELNFRNLFGRKKPNTPTQQPQGDQRTVQNPANAEGAYNSEPSQEEPQQNPEKKQDDEHRNFFNPERNGYDGYTGTNTNRIYADNNPFYMPKQTQYSPEVQRTIDRQKQEENIAQVTQNVKELIMQKSQLIAQANKAMAQAKNLCKQNGLDIAQIMTQMGINNNATRKYAEQQRQIELNNNYASTFNDAMDESYMRKRYRRF